MPDPPTKRDDAMTPTDPAESPSYYPARKGITTPASKAVKSSPPGRCRTAGTQTFKRTAANLRRYPSASHLPGRTESDILACLFIKRRTVTAISENFWEKL